MNKKEVAEIRKILKKENTRIDKIAGCYVDGEQGKHLIPTTSFFSVQEEEVFKLSAIFQKALSGKIGKNLNTLEFSLDEEITGTNHKLLLHLRDTGLGDAQTLEAFYDHFIESYSAPGNYLILMGYGNYDIPCKGKDNLELEDASEYVYSFVLCCICPVNMSKPGLCYDETQEIFISRLPDKMVEAPGNAFLFPAFHDRNQDIHSILFYSKNEKEAHPEIVENVLGCESPMIPSSQKELFRDTVEQTLGEDCTFEAVKHIHEELLQTMNESADEEEPASVGKEYVKKILRDTGASEECMENIEESFQECYLENVTEIRKFTVETPEISIRVDADRTDLLESMVINGRECIVIPVDEGILVNGIQIHSKGEVQ